MEIIGLSFEADLKFGSLDEGAKFLRDECVLELPTQSWLEHLPYEMRSPVKAPIERLDAKLDGIGHVLADRTLAVPV